MTTRFGTIHVDKFLTNVAIRHTNESYIGANVGPVITVAKQSDLIPSYGKEHFRLYDDEIVSTKATKEVDPFSLSNVTYFCQPRGMKTLITKEDRANADKPVDPEVDATVALKEIRLARRDFNVSAAAFNVTTFTNQTETLTASGDENAQWDDFTNSDPLKKIDAKIDIIRKAIGRKPNSVTMGAVVWKSLKRHPDLVHAYNATVGGRVTIQQFLDLFDSLKFVNVGDPVYQSSIEGQSTVTNTDLWGNFFLLHYRGRNTLKSPNTIITFAWKIYGGNGMLTEKWMNNDPNGTYIKVSNAETTVVTSAESGYLIVNPVGG